MSLDITCMYCAELSESQPCSRCIYVRTLSDYQDRLNLSIDPEEITRLKAKIDAIILRRKLQLYEKSLKK